MADKMTLKPGSGGNFGFSAGGLRASAQGNPVPYLMPWALALVMLVLAVVVRFALAGDSMAWFWSSLTLAVYAGLAAITWRASRARGQLVQYLATGGVAVGGVWSWVMAGMDGLTWRAFALYGLLSLLVCGGANMFQAMKSAGSGEGDGGQFGRLGGALDKVRNLHSITATDTGQVKAGFQMEPGTPATELQDAIPAITSLYGLPPDGVRVIPSQDDSSAGELILSPTNPLRNPPVWTGPSIPRGGSLADPIVLGVRRSGGPAQYWMPGDPDQDRNASLMSLVGMSGAGKTMFLRLTLVEFLSRVSAEEGEYWYLNSRKGDQEPPWVRRGASRVENTRKGVAQALRDLYQEMGERARFLGERGFDQWQPGCGLKYRLVICDEFADVAPEIAKLFTNLAETLRSLGVHLICGFQRASGTRFPTDARANFNTKVCMGVNSEDDAEMALPDDVLEAGAAPWIWGAKVPGMFYMSAPGVSENVWAEECRTFRVDPALLERWADYYIDLRARGMSAASTPSPRPTAASTGPARPVQRPSKAQASADDGFIPDLGDEDDDDVDLDSFTVTEQEAADLEEMDLDADPDEVDSLVRDVDDGLDDDGDELDAFDDADMPQAGVPADVAGELAGVSLQTPIEPTEGMGGMRLSLVPQMPSEQARAYVKGWFGQLHAQNIVLVKKENMGDLLAHVGYKASWLDKVLAEFIAEQPAWLQRADSRGWYEIVATPPAGVAA
jgi:hypothetical protein